MLMSTLGNGEYVKQDERLVAVIRREDVKLPSRNFVGLPPMAPDEPDIRRPLPIPFIIVISTRSDGIFLERFDEAGADAGDSWHQSIEEAKEQAREEYGESIGVWTPVPESEENPVAFGLRLADVDR
jgi:hypothetical protein